VALYRMARDRKSLMPIHRFALCWMLPGLLFLSASAFKSRHYAAPLMPPLALLAAVELNHFIARRGMRSAYRAWLLASTCMAVCAVGVVAVIVNQSKGQAGLVAVLTVIAIGVGAITWLGSQRRVVPQFAALFATVWLASIGVLTLVLPYHDSYRDQAVLAQDVNRQVPANAKLYLLRLPDNQVTYYLSSQMVRVDDELEAFETIASEESTEVYALAPEFLARRLAKLGRLEVLGRCASVNRYLKDYERMTFIRLTRSISVASSAANRSQETCR
jgi:4-amino-4-deoxy-L-arabinose transferase-like glycosyltransferase